MVNPYSDLVRSVTLRPNTSGRLVLPTPTGTGTLTMSLRGSVTGLSLDGYTLVISSTFAAGTRSFGIRVVSSDDPTNPDESVLHLTVIRADSGPAYSPSPIALTLGATDAGTAQISAATGSPGTISYRLVSPPSGITLSGRTLSVAGTVAANTYNLTVVARWTNGVNITELNRTISLTIARETSLQYSDQTTSVTQGGTHTLPAASGGTSPYTYALGQAAFLENWTRVGTTQSPTIATGRNVRVDFAVRPSDNQLFAAVITDSAEFTLYTINRTTGAWTSIRSTRLSSFTATGRAVISFSPNGNLYLMFTGAANAFLAQLNTSAGGSPFTVNPQQISGRNASNTVNFVATSNTAGYIATSAANPQLIPITLSSRALGTAINFATGHSVKDLFFSGGVVYATTEGSDLLTLTVSNSARRILFSSGARDAQEGLAIVGSTAYTAAKTSTGNVFQLHQATLRIPSTGVPFSSTLPTGVTFNATTRVINVASTATTGLKRLALRVRDSSSPVGEAIRPVNLTVTAAAVQAVAGTFSVANKTLTLSSTQTQAFDVEAASGGTGTVSYSLVNPPSGVTISGRRVTIATTVASQTLNLRARATWTSGSTTATRDATFSVVLTRTQRARTGTFNPRIFNTLNLSSTQSGTVTFNAATGGTGTITYSLRTSRAGITLSGRTITVASSYTTQITDLNIRATWTTPENSIFLERVIRITLNRTQAPAVGSWTVANKTVSLTHNGSGTSTLEAATGGTGTITYALVSPPSGITLSGRTINIAGTVTAGAKALTARATWTTPEGTRSLTRSFTLTVNRSAVPAAVGTWTVDGTLKTLNTSSRGTASYTFEAASGGTGTISYSLVDGHSQLSLSGRTITWASLARAGRWNVFIRATWTSGSSTATLDRTVRVTLVRTSAPAAGQHTISNKTLNLTSSGTGTATIEAATGGTGTITYALLSPPTGISLSGRTISVAANAAAQAHSLTVRATWTTPEGSRTRDTSFTLTVNRTQAPQAGSFSVDNETLNLTLTSSGTFDINAASGGTGTISYALVSPRSGITLNGRTVTVSGSVPAGTYNMTAQATWTTVEGSRTRNATFTIVVNRAAVIPDAAAGSFSVSNRTVSLQGPVSHTLTIEQATGGTGTVSYSLRNAPTGWTLSGRTLTIAGSVATVNQSLTARAMWTSANGTTAHRDSTFSVNLTRTPNAATGTFTVAAKTINTSSTGTGSVTLEAATGGTGTVGYTLVSPPAGITLRGRLLAVSSSVAAGDHSITVRATWTSGTSSVFLDSSFTLTLVRTSAAAAGTFSVSDQSLNLSSTGSGTFDLNTATGGVGTVSYSLVSPPAGFSLSGQTVTVAGSVRAGTHTVTARATWTTTEGTATRDSTFTVVVARAVAPQAGTFEPKDQTLTLAQGASGTVTVDAATGGVGTIAYTLISTQAGITLSGLTLSVGGAVTAADYTITVRATWTTSEGSAAQTASFTLSVVRTARPATLPEVTDKTVVTGADALIAVLPTISGSDDTWTYSIRTDTPGVTFDPTTRILGVLSTLRGEHSVTYRAVFESQTLEQTFTISGITLTGGTSGLNIPPGARIQVKPSPVEHPRARGTNYKIYINGQLAGLGDDDGLGQ